MSDDVVATWLLAAAALHLGFQATVTLLVYPALAEHGRGGGEWRAVHAAHSRRITPLVVLVYGALLPPVVVTAWRLVQGDKSWASGVAALAAAAAFAATALVAAPAHSALTQGWDERVGLRLLRSDVLRLAAAGGCLAGAVVAI